MILLTFRIPNLLAIGAKMNTCKNIIGTATIPVAMPSWSVEKSSPSGRRIRIKFIYLVNFFNELKKFFNQLFFFFIFFFIFFYRNLL